MYSLAGCMGFVSIKKQIESDEETKRKDIKKRILYWKAR